jgi:hypothetical protein
MRSANTRFCAKQEASGCTHPCTLMTTHRCTHYGTNSSAGRSAVHHAVIGGLLGRCAANLKLCKVPA